MYSCPLGCKHLEATPTKHLKPMSQMAPSFPFCPSLLSSWTLRLAAPSIYPAAHSRNSGSFPPLSPLIPHPLKHPVSPSVPGLYAHCHHLGSSHHCLAPGFLQQPGANRPSPRVPGLSSPHILPAAAGCWFQSSDSISVLPL